jgi:hypothetical protein
MKNNYNNVIDNYIKLLKEIFIETGSLLPSITVIGTEKTNQQNAVIKIIIDNKYLASEDMKDKFMTDVIPDASKDINKRFDVHAVLWAAEAWVRTLKKTDDDNIDPFANWKDIPIEKEILLISIESNNRNETIVFDIIRKRKLVNEDGELVDELELKECLEYSDGAFSMGRFKGLYEKFTA